MELNAELQQAEAIKCQIKSMKEKLHRVDELLKELKRHAKLQL